MAPLTSRRGDRGRRLVTTTLNRLTGAAHGTRLSDRVVPVAVPLVATLAFDAPPQLIGILVARRSSAAPMGSIPLGILVDQARPRTLAILPASLSGFTGAVASVVLGAARPFGASITVAGLGAVPFGLAAPSILPGAAGAGSLAGADAAIEVPRALRSLAVPPTVALVIGDVPAWAFLVVAGLGSVVAPFAASPPRFEVAPPAAEPIAIRIASGARIVAGHRLLPSTSIRAMFRNLALDALLVVPVPVIREACRFDPGAFGIASSASGPGAFLGASLVRRAADRIAPRIIPPFGPGSPVAAAGVLTPIDPRTPGATPHRCFLSLGFGPSMGLVAQNSARRLASPPAMPGRVNAVVQTAI